MKKKFWFIQINIDIGYYFYYNLENLLKEIFMYKQSLFASLALAMLSTNSFANEEIKKLNDIIVTSKSNQSIEYLSNTVTIITASRF
jgi:hypothetical protein